MKALCRILILLVLLCPWVSAADSLGQVLRARALLGEGAWSEVMQIQRSRRHAVYPTNFHGLVFEFNTRLWFYTPVEGTRALSYYGQNGPEEKARASQLIEGVIPDARVSILSLDGSEAPSAMRPRNACFLESLFHMRELERLPDVRNPRLFSYFYRIPSGHAGHTVLLYETNTGLWCRDPNETKAERIPADLVTNTQAIARSLEPRMEILHVRTDLVIGLGNIASCPVVGAPSRIGFSKDL